MEMVSSVKLRNARTHMLNARPYAQKIAEIAAHISQSPAQFISPLTASRPVKTCNLIIVSSDKGMCGGFNSNVFKKAVEFIHSHKDRKIILTLIGKKAVDFFKNKNYSVSDRYAHIFSKPSYSDASKIGQKILSDFRSGAIDEVYIVYNKFKSAATQQTNLDIVLPVSPAIGVAAGVQQSNYLLEPDDNRFLDILLSHYFLFQIWQVFLESFASEQGARMAAMSGATKNAGELIDKFTLYYNKARQTAITTELLEVVSGAESLR